MDKKDRKITKRNVLSAVFIALYFAVVICSGVYLVPSGKGLYVLAFAFILVLGVILLAAWFSTSEIFTCKQCKHQFKINVYKDLFSPQKHNVKYLKCPKCKETTWAKFTVKN